MKFNFFKSEQPNINEAPKNKAESSQSWKALRRSLFTATFVAGLLIPKVGEAGDTAEISLERQKIENMQRKASCDTKIQKLEKTQTERNEDMEKLDDKYTITFDQALEYYNAQEHKDIDKEDMQEAYQLLESAKDYVDHMVDSLSMSQEQLTELLSDEQKLDEFLSEVNSFKNPFTGKGMEQLQVLLGGELAPTYAVKNGVSQDMMVHKFLGEATEQQAYNQLEKHAIGEYLAGFKQMSDRIAQQLEQMKGDQVAAR